jgi:hypothetical protein
VLVTGALTLYEHTPFIADPKSTAVRCPCGYNLTQAEVSKMLVDYFFFCKKGCEQETEALHMNVGIRDDHKHLLVDAAVPRYWWHVTRKNPWLPPANVMVHVGTPKTVAWYRRFYPKASPLSPHPLVYRAELKPDTVLTEGLAEDFNQWPMWVNEAGNTATRYVNKIEVPGSISLLVPFGCLTNVQQVANFAGARNNPPYRA